MEAIQNSITENVVVSVISPSGEIWNCNGLETDESRMLEVYADIKSINVPDIVEGILGQLDT